jgi:lipoprotein-releasing system permease protein
MTWALYLALRQLFPSGRRVSFFTAISVVSVALGVALLIVVLSVFSGFGREIHRMFIDTQGEVQVRGNGYIAKPAELLQELAKIKGVAACTPFAEGVVMIENEKRPAFPGIQGIDVDRIEKVIPLRKYIRVGNLDDLDDDSVILSYQLARSLGAHVGSKVEVYTPLLLEKLKSDEVVLPSELRVVGLLEVGHQQLDSSMVLCTLRRMQGLYGLGGGVHGVNLRLVEGADAETTATAINNSLAGRLGVQARSWFEINQEFLSVLRLEKTMMTFIMLFVVLVAAFLTMSLLLVLVIKKTREIGLLAALGAERREIALCFCFQGVWIGVVGTGLGLALGLTALHFRNDIVRGIMKVSGGQDLLAKFYQFQSLPSYTEPVDLAVIIISAIVLSTLAGLIPALIAARMRPVDALRSE